jgi:hypothetical protein
MRRVMNDAMLSAGALLALLTVLVAVDGRVREHALRLGHGRGNSDLAFVSGQARDLASVALGVVSDSVRMHPTLAIFVVAATVLTVFMVRT